MVVSYGVSLCEVQLPIAGERMYKVNTSIRTASAFFSNNPNPLVNGALFTLYLSIGL